MDPSFLNKLESKLMQISHGIPHSTQPLAVTIGNFDGVHLGHQAMLQRLKQTADTLGIATCVLTFEPHPREFFTPEQAPARLTSLREKLEYFAGFGIDRVHICRFNRPFSQLSAPDFIERILRHGLQTKWLLVGDDFRFGAKRTGDFSLLRQTGTEQGFEVAAMESVTLDGLRVSSTAVREALAAGKLAFANRLLGRPYSISGRVVHGDKLGKKIGFPTANIQIKHNKPPLSGIFAVELSGIGDAKLPGVASLGVRPTVKENGRMVLEAHLFDFDQRIYGQHVRVDFLHKLRDEEKYTDLDTLIRQIELDVENTHEFFRRNGAETDVKAKDA
jgi:riboflavin kinase/FMN adenylyltransferase